ncbi:FAD-binding oxidoreductase [Pseudoxanthomonas winnipegensis]|jgi:FAD/FMN-containing dehydrogenase|uniref:FAD-binding oxidoreductase n=1 Tax=Pseudoxanthomonas winnipegensis TaxID=2480810 RepID=A0ABY1WIZ7_9GAMM|nr:FAD-binding oxidoreductase [Pseudoxanthomonas winnipegensis]TAA10000.1 FAD-binding oxidoreductase [Pseudoxanthomonas winnipegensis]TAA22621.1 FAD-binding oxidoreductase [Pseudoxanthomonas winnipegensis]TAH73033.1 FAD-binding oxidoreductase [Pseudoxanthomonas winnipegensis]
MTRSVGQSWGRYPLAEQTVVSVRDRTASLPDFSGHALPRGNGRSYGDSCLDPGGTLLHARHLDRFMFFDPATGTLCCEAGVTLAEIIDLVLPQGWFLPVTPGTRYVTVGGAIANDVHGKNHHLTGSFGHHVDKLELLRSDGARLVLAPEDALFSATIGGLGLTGMITWAQLQLRRIPGPWLETESIRFDTLDDFFALSRDSASRFEYTVAWIDCLAKDKRLGRGHFLRADHARGEVFAPSPSGVSSKCVPLVPPFSLVNGLSLRPFNTLYYWKQPARMRRELLHYQRYFYPLDGISHWNRMYGPRGFLQHQCVLPAGNAREAVAELLSEIARSGNGSFLAVLKEFGEIPSLGMLSFPRAGTTLALDFRNDGGGVFSLLNRLDAIVNAAGGAIYPAKDARMSSQTFRYGYPRWEEFSTFIDPRLSSGFWRRVTSKPTEH